MKPRRRNAEAISFHTAFKMCRSSTGSLSSGRARRWRREGGRKSQPHPVSRSRDPTSPAAHLPLPGVPWLVPLIVSRAAPGGKPRFRLLEVSASPGQPSTGAARLADPLVPAN
ncbi:hypothetical protein NDU88_005770 [Pleurodeles waltl]|uniref:Uncharacterized protein n=1 Tax=Pleurodeles waltl TaxID=8319 RepID=A0AAV7TCD5_PLEWA|nr:hypothetical protein NDU88_005770 [Pleurodeles waltl]